jgi:hypothetical protein
MNLVKKLPYPEAAFFRVDNKLPINLISIINMELQVTETPVFRCV